jgi:hypothetical protein
MREILFDDFRHCLHQPARYARAKEKYDGLLDSSEKLLYRIKLDLDEAKKILTGPDERLRNIGPLCRQGELFDEAEYPKYDERLAKTVLDSLVETI